MLSTRYSIKDLAEVCQKYKNQLEEVMQESGREIKNKMAGELHQHLEAVINACRGSQNIEEAVLRAAGKLKSVFDNSLDLVGTKRSVIGSIKDRYHGRKASLNTILANYSEDKRFKDTLTHFNTLADAQLREVYNFKA